MGKRILQLATALSQGTFRAISDQGLDDSRHQTCLDSCRPCDTQLAAKVHPELAGQEPPT